MLKLSVPQLGNEILFETTLEPIAYEVEKLVKGREKGVVEINAFFGKKNKVAVGVPYYENLILRLLEKNEEIPHEIKHMSDDYDFHFVSLSCSFLPDRDCKFIWARFRIELRAISETGEPSEEEPVAYDMFPREVLSEISYGREVNFSPEIKFSLGAVNTGTRWFHVGTQKKFIIYEPQIFAFGINRSSVGWDFKSTKEKGLWGNKKDLLLIIRASKGAKIRGRFLFDAEVGFNIGKWIPIPLSKKEDDLVNAEYNLSE